MTGVARDAVAETKADPNRSRREAKLVAIIERLRSDTPPLQIENVRIAVCADPEEIALDRDGEGGHFSIREFADVLHQFISERL